MDPKLAYLQDFALMRGMSPTELTRLHALLKTKDFKPDVALCREDAKVENVFFLNSGTVAVLKRGPDGNDRQILTLDAPTVIGEAELIDALPASATVVTTVPTSASILSAEHYDQLALQAPGIAAKLNRNLARVLARRLHATNLELVSLVDPTKLPDFHLVSRKIATRWQLG